MKKLSLLIALCMLLTISGVYAAWVYTENTIPADEESVRVVLADPSMLGNAGELHIVSNTIEALIDQKAVGDYSAVLKVTGSATITFTPNIGSPVGIVDTIEAKLLLTDIPSYEGEPIYTVANGGLIDVTWTENEGVYSAEITPEMISQTLILSDKIYLPTIQDYEAFVTLERPAVVTLRVEPITFS